MVHQNIKCGTKDFNSSENVRQTAIFEVLNPVTLKISELLTVIKYQHTKFRYKKVQLLRIQNL